MGMIAPQQGLAVLEQIFAAPPVQVGVVPINWSTFKDKRPFWADLQPVRVSARLGILQKLRTMPADKHRPLLEAHVREQVAQVLGHKRAAISLSQGLFEMGMDSLTSVELRNHLQSNLECSLPSTFAFDYPTVGALVDYLAQEIRGHLKTDIPSTGADITRQEASHQQDKELISVSQESPLDDMAQRLAKKLGIKVG
jgi:acyl carrier protein